jgi:hypothetical protein
MRVLDVERANWPRDIGVGGPKPPWLALLWLLTSLSIDHVHSARSPSQFGPQSWQRGACREATGWTLPDGRPDIRTDALSGHYLVCTLISEAIG